MKHRKHCLRSLILPDWSYNFYIGRLLSQVNVLTKTNERNKKAQLSLTNPRDSKACQKIAPIRRAYSVVADNTGLYLHSFSCCCVRNLRNPEKFTENSNLWSSRSSNVIDLAVFILGIFGGGRNLPPPQKNRTPPKNNNNSNTESVKYGKIIKIVAFRCVS